MSSRRQFLGAAAACAALATGGSVSGTDGGDTPADALNLEHWRGQKTKEFTGTQYTAADEWSFAWADTPFVTVDVTPDHDSELSLEFRKHDSDNADTVTSVAFASTFTSDTPDFYLSSHCEIDVAPARELAHLILKETEPVTEVE